MNLLKAVKTPVLASCATAAVIGLLLLIWPVFILQFICILLAIGLIAVGVLRIMTYFKDKKTSMPPLNLALGLFLIIAGIAMIAENSLLIFILPFILCLAVWFATLLMLQRTYDLFKAHVADWWIEGIIALIGLVLSIILLATLRSTMLASTISTLVSGISPDLLSAMSMLSSDFANISNGSMLLTALSLIYSALAVIATEIFIDMRIGKKPAAKAAAPAMDADTLNDLK